MNSIIFMKILYIYLTLILFILAGCSNNSIQNNDTIKSENYDNCKELEKEIKNLLENNNFCSKDFDCVLLRGDAYLGCPFGCHNFVNKNIDFSNIEKAALEYQKNKCRECLYKCRDSPSQEEIGCKNNKCVDLRNIE